MKKPITKDYILYDSICVTSCNVNILERKDGSVMARGEGWREKVQVGHENKRTNQTIFMMLEDLHCGGGYIPTQ